MVVRRVAQTEMTRRNAGLHLTAARPWRVERLLNACPTLCFTMYLRMCPCELRLEQNGVLHKDLTVCDGEEAGVCN